MLHHKRHLLRSSNCVFRQAFGCSRFVPQHEPVHEKDVEHLAKFLEDKPNILVLTGAGVSTESGDAWNIPVNVSEPQTNAKFYFLFKIHFHLHFCRDPRLSFGRCWTVCTQWIASGAALGIHFIAENAAAVLGTELCRVAHIFQFSAE